MVVKLANLEDEEWIMQIVGENRKMFGRSVENNWFTYWDNYEDRKDKEYWMIVPGKAFLHVKIKKNGNKTIDSLGVKSEFKRQGIGSYLVNLIQGNVKVKTDWDNDESNNFYLKNGFSRFGGQVNARFGNKVFNVYKKW